MKLSREKLIAYYEKQVIKVRQSYPTNTKYEYQNNRNAEYIQCAENNLRDVLNGREW